MFGHLFGLVRPDRVSVTGHDQTTFLSGLTDMDVSVPFLIQPLTCKRNLSELDEVASRHGVASYPSFSIPFTIPEFHFKVVVA